MNNFRIIYDNKADIATLAASSTAGGLVVANMLTDLKSDVWRSTSTTASITLTWASACIIGGVALPFTNLSSAATIRVRGYTNAGDPTPVFDTGTILACPPLALTLWGWGTLPLGVNAFTYGGAAYGDAWTPITSVKQVVIDLDDTTNPAGYIEVGRLVAGSYWEGSKGADYGAGSTPVDTSTQLRNDAGDLMTDRGTMHKKQTVPLTTLSPTERQTLWNILIGNGLFRPVYLSMYPDSADTGLEQSGMLYGKLVNSPAVTTPAFREYATSLEIEEV